jgi:hypothetical protein
MAAIKSLVAMKVSGCFGKQMFAMGVIACYEKSMVLMESQ